MSKLLDLINQKKQAIQSNNRGRTVKPPEGTSTWRILPRWDGNTDGEFWHDFGQHFIKDTKGQLKAVYVCTDKTFGQPCQVCDAIQHGIMTSPNDEVKQTIEGAKAAGRVLLNAVNLGGEKIEAAILELSPNVFSQLLSIMGEWGTEEILALKQGRAITIERTGKGLQTKYSLQASSRKTDLPEAIMKQATDLDDYVKQESVEQERRALANLKQVAGLLSGPASSKPDLASVAAELDDMGADGTNDIPETVTETKVDAPAAATTAADSDASGMDELLKEIEGL